MNRVLRVCLAGLLGAGAAAPAAAQVSPGPLATAHARYDEATKCLVCHEAGRELSGRKCLTCHASLGARIQAGQGYHATATRNGAALACGSCHSEHNGRPYRLVRWPDNRPQEQFDHTQTGFTLQGAHARLTCTDCHKASMIATGSVRSDTSLNVGRTFLGLGTTCASCHLDEHRGRTSRQCGDCHGQDQWKPAPRFDHSRTRFALTGRHQALECAECHEIRRDVASGPGGTRDTAFVDFRTARPSSGGCTGCHTSPHRGAQFTRCEGCHTTEGWFVLPDSLRRFDHSGTGFPLGGAHAAARCESCHLSSATSPLPARVALVRANFTRRLSRQPMLFSRCGDCHADVHGDQLRPGRDCVACHDDARFSPARFGPEAHDSLAFRLTGAHGAVPCTGCHQTLPGARTHSGQVRFRIADTRCVACHDNPHGTQFADRTCESCHTTEAWERVTFDHDRTRYPLRGAHLTKRCSACHTRERPGAPIRFRGLPLTCGNAGCHVDPHGGQFGNRERGSACTTCHNEERWRPALFDHQTDSDWPLDGAHRRVPCRSCHRPDGTPPVVRFRGTPKRCEDCHR
jgi:hypothetical protein